MSKPASLKELNTYYIWEQDGWVDNWRVMSETYDGFYRGDCDDYAMTVLWILARYSRLRMIWYLVTFRAVFWHVRAHPTGEGHLVLWFRDLGWIDNLFPYWRKEPTYHRKVFPWPWPLIPLKLLTRLITRS